MKETLEKMYSLSLVALQLAALLYLALTGPLIARELALFLFQLAGVCIAAWALWNMWGTNWRIAPEPHPRARLVTKGIYRHIRHPMYTSVLVITASWVIMLPLGKRVIVWFGLAMILWIKLRREERLLEGAFGEKYRRYCRTTKRLVPNII